jgi:V/A-type H+-transporting ATPase subunit E
MSKLGDILQQEVVGEIDAILAEAASQAAKLVREADEKASARLESYRKTLNAEARAAARRAESAAQLTVSAARMAAKGRIMDSVRERALKALEETADRPDYGEILQALAEEALEAVEAAAVVVVHPDDEERLDRWAARKGLELRTDPGLRLGVRIVNRGGKRSVENSLPDRLNRAWSALASGVAQRLWV